MGPSGGHRAPAVIGHQEVVPVEEHIVDLHRAVDVEEDLPAAVSGVQGVDRPVALAVVVDDPVPDHQVPGEGAGGEGAHRGAVVHVQLRLPEEGEVEGVPLVNGVAVGHVVGVVGVVVDPVVLGVVGGGVHVHPVGRAVPGHLAVKGLRHRPDGHQDAVVHGDGGHVQGDELAALGGVLGHHVLPQHHGDAHVAPDAVDDGVAPGDGGAQGLEPLHMLVDGAHPEVAAAGHGNAGPPAPGEQRPQQVVAGPHIPGQFVGDHRFPHLGGVDLHRIPVQHPDLGPQTLEDLVEHRHVADVGDVLYGADPLGQDGGGDDRHSRIFRAADGDLPGQGVSALYNKFFHLSAISPRLPHSKTAPPRAVRRAANPIT